MPSGKTIDDDAHVRERLAELCRTHSQSGVARKVGTSPANVSRYLKGNRIPAEFCSKLIRELGVNPAWLMVGEGSAMLSDVTERTAKMGSGVLELVEALNAVTRMRLGALTGAHHLRVLRELNEALKHYETLRERLNQQSVPIFQRLLHDMRDALARKDLDRAGELREACAQVARLCDAEDLMTDFEAAQGHLEYLSLHTDRAISHQSRVFIRRVLKAGEFGSEGLIQAHNYTMILQHVGRRSEARRVARATLELAGEDDWQLRAVAATLDLELGDLERGLDTLRRAMPRVRPDYRHNVEQSLARGQLLEGSMTIEQAMAFAPDTDATWSRLLSFATAVEDKSALQRLLPLAMGELPQKLPPDAEIVTAARAILHPTVRAAKTLMEGSKTNKRALAVEKFERLVTATQVFRLAGRRKEALDSLLKAAGSEDPRRQPTVERRICHARNVLELVKPGEKREELRQARRLAAGFVLEYLERGYACLAPLRALASAPATAPR